MNKEVTDADAIEILKRLIKDRERKKKNLILFVADEIGDLQMEINNYRRQILQIEKEVGNK